VFIGPGGVFEAVGSAHHIGQNPAETRAAFVLLGQRRCVIFLSLPGVCAMLGAYLDCHENNLHPIEP
jgi:hypothetical protein